MPKYPSSTKQMTRGQVQTEPELTLVRKETVLADSVIYIFALGLKIMATKKGVTFSGSSTLFNPEQLDGIKRIIRKASKIHTELAAHRGLPPEDELDGKVLLRCSKSISGEATVWYKNTPTRIKAPTLARAVSELRAQYRASQKS